MPLPDDFFGAPPPDLADQPDLIVGSRADREAWYRTRSRILGEQYRLPAPTDDPAPAFEERVARCRAMGILVCTCTGVDRGEGEPRLLVYDPRCAVHGTGEQVA